MTKQKICETCQHGNVAETKFCVKCGQPFANHSTVVSIDKEVPSETNVCAHVNNGNGVFCVKCGEPFLNQEEPAAPIAPSKNEIVDEPTPVKRQKASSTKNKKIAIILGTLLIALVACWWILEKTLSNKDELIATLQQVVVSGDVDKFYEALIIEDISDEEKKAYKNYLDENDVSKMANVLVKSINVLDDSDQLLTQVAPEDSEVDEFKVVKIIKFGLFQSYEIQPIKFKVYAETNSDSIEISIANQTKVLPLEETEAIGEFLPGQYPYTLTWDTEIGTVKEERNHHVWPNDSYVLDGTLAMYEVDLIDGPYPDWNYLINGKQVDLKEYTVDGRLVVPVGVEFELVATFKEDGTEYKSEPLRITQSIYPDFFFPKYEEMQAAAYAKEEAEREKEYARQEAERNIATLIYDYLWIYSNGDVNSLNTVISTDSVFYKDQTKYLQSLVDKNTEAVINNHEILDMKENGKDSYTVTVNESYMIYKPNAEPNVVNQKSIYTVKLIGSQYYITAFKLGK